MFKTKYTFYLISLSLIVLVSCSEYNKVLKSGDYDLKYRKAVEYYEKKDYYRAQALLEDLRGIYRGTEKAEKVFLYTAHCAYGLGEYSLAGYLFKEYTKLYPQSAEVENIEFLAAYCSYLISPESSIEQSYTNMAINDFQIFVDKYPNSQKRKEAEEIMDKLHLKLENKAINNAMLFFKIMDYKAAIVSLKNVLKDFPDTKQRENIMFTIVQSSYQLAENSVYSKRIERYKATISEYQAFIDKYPNSHKIKEAEKIYTNSLKFIDNKNGL